MGAEVMIRAEGLGKKYVIGHQADRPSQGLLRDALVRNARNLARSARDLVSGRANVGGDEIEDFWALKDLEFEIARGDVVGVIGRNGAGKSTLLKILSRITEPSSGRVEIHGRVASLLEVGTGFHPELTGRENIFLNGAILGMSRAEIRRKFDEIVDFAEVERFLDTPVKRYSSGMYVRLAFAVAAHLEPEILVVDEVLAVGDLAFQRKCLGKMQDVASHGRTVLFVSHNMAAIEKLCSRGIYLEGGRITAEGPARTVISTYLSSSEDEVLEYVPDSDASRDAEIQRIVLCDGQDKPAKQLTTAEAPRLRIDVLVRRRRSDLKLAFALSDQMETPIFASCPPDDGVEYPSEPGLHRFTAAFPGPVLMAQRYSITVSLYSTSGGVLHNCVHALTFDVTPGLSKLYEVEPNRVGLMQMFCRWDHSLQG